MDPLTILAALGALAGAGSLATQGIGMWQGSKTKRKELDLQRYMADLQATTAKRSTEESRANAEKYMEAIMKMKGEEKRESRRQELMQNFMSSQDRQAAMVMQAMQSLNQNKQSVYSPGGGMVNLMRSNF